MINTSQSVWIVDYQRSAFSKAHPFKSEVDAFSDLPALDLLAQLINSALDNATYPRDTIGELVLGCAFPVKDQWSFGGRYPVMQSKLTFSCAAKQIEQQCASGLAAIVEGAQAVMLGGSEAVMCGGYENMSRIPMGPSLFEEGVLTVPCDDVVHDNHPNTDMAVAMNMGLTAERLAEHFDVTRAQMDAYACRSHERAGKAQQDGFFKNAIVPIYNISGELLIDQDANVRPETTVEKLEALRPVFKETGVVSAGNSSPLTSGAALLTLMSDKACAEHAVDPLGRIVTACSIGVDPEMMGYGVIPAIEKLLSNAELDCSAIDLWEINEAFAVVPMAAIKHFSLDESRVNVFGGAIAIGHPLGASGVRLVGQLAEMLVHQQKRYGVAALCVGGGQGVAMLIENPRLH